MKTEWIRAVSEKYISKIDTMRDRGKKDYCHFDFVVRNLISHINPTWAQLIEEEKWKWEDIRKDYVASMKALRTYLDLLENKASYRKLELSTIEGAFDHKDKEDVLGYICLSKAKLE